MGKAVSTSCLGKRMMEKLSSCDIIFKEREGVCMQFLSLRIDQWRSEAEEVNIQRHRLNIREKGSTEHRRVAGRKAVGAPAEKVN